ncbi:MAG: Flp pilus assembly complex ATPase component TadA [Magnetococcales bacterium]|nr:Flp pilus assembly complex ATPase component TadA [Magnetococcales bacterium]
MTGMNTNLYFQIQPALGEMQELSKQLQDSYLIGRRAKTGSQICDIIIDDPYSSRRQCRIFRNPKHHDQWMMEDLRSSNGTKLNGEPVLRPMPFSENSWIQVGTTRITISSIPKCGTDVDEIIMAPGDDEATIVAPGGIAAAVVDDDEATIMAPAAVVDDDEATIMAPAPPADDNAETIMAPTPRGSQGAGDATIVVSNLEMPSRHDAEAAPQPHPSHPAPPAVILDKSEQVKIAMNSELIQMFINANYLEPLQVTRLLEEAQNNGLTFYQALARDRTLKFVNEIFTEICNKFGWELITDEKVLGSRIVATDWLPISSAEVRGILALRSDDSERISFGTIDPFDVMSNDWVARCSGKPADMSVILPDVFFPCVRRMKEAPASEDDSSNEVSVIEINIEEEQQIREQIGEVEVPRIVDYFFYRAHIQGASDIHIEPMEDALMVRNRVDGILHEEITLPMEFHPEIVSRFKILSGMDVAEKRRPQDGRISTLIRNNPIDVRVSSFPTVFGEKFVMRLLDKNALRPSMDSLGLVDRDLRLLKEKLGAPYGLVMISGPTGSGKTTTLYSCLGGIDKNKLNVLTVEDPVEYRLAGVHQMQVNHKIDLTFASGLRTILRQDPDVIMVGEIRDQETAEMAVQASLTGHIVFSTIHTNDAVGVVGRLLEMGIEPFLVATSLSLVIAQRLIRTNCTHCTSPVLGAEILEKLGRDGASKERLDSVGIEIDPEMEYAQGSGCSHCRDSGYHGRRAVFEMFEMTDEARNLVMSPTMNSGTLRQLAKDAGMTSLVSHGVQLVEEEVTTFAEVIRVLGEEN